MQGCSTRFNWRLMTSIAENRPFWFILLRLINAIAQEWPPHGAGLRCAPTILNHLTRHPWVWTNNTQEVLLIRVTRWHGKETFVANILIFSDIKCIIRVSPKRLRAYTFKVILSTLMFHFKKTPEEVISFAWPRRSFCKLGWKPCRSWQHTWWKLPICMISELALCDRWV